MNSKDVKVLVIAIISLLVLPLISGCAGTNPEYEAKQRAQIEEVQGNKAAKRNVAKSDGTIMSRNMGGDSEMLLKANQKLVMVTWKEKSLWLTTREMRPEEKAETYTFQENSRWGLLEGTIIIKEQRE